MVDSLANEICKTIELSREPNDSLRVFNSFHTHLAELTISMDPKEAEDFSNKIFFRLQKNCAIFWKILKRNSPQTEYWKQVDKIPVSKLTLPDYERFKKIRSFIYFEPTGDSVIVSIKNSQWEEKFADNTFSLLDMKWVNDSTFGLSFVKSDNLIRKNFSNRGDKYTYYLIDKGENYYLLCTGTNERGGIFSLFKVFY